MRRRLAIAIAVLLLMSVPAFVLVLVALGALGAGIVGADSQPLSEAQVERELAATPAPNPLPGRASSASTAGTAVATDGGSARVACNGQQPTVLFVNPAPGFTYYTIDAGPKALATTQFGFGSNHAKISVSVSCATGSPEVTVRHG